MTRHLAPPPHAPPIQHVSPDAPFPPSCPCISPSMLVKRELLACTLMALPLISCRLRHSGSHSTASGVEHATERPLGTVSKACEDGNCSSNNCKGGWRDE